MRLVPSPTPRLKTRDFDAAPVRDSCGLWRGPRLILKDAAMSLKASLRSEMRLLCVAVPVLSFGTLVPRSGAGLAPVLFATVTGLAADPFSSSPAVGRGGAGLDAATTGILAVCTGFIGGLLCAGVTLGRGGAAFGAWVPNVWAVCVATLPGTDGPVCSGVTGFGAGLPAGCPGLTGATGLGDAAGAVGRGATDFDSTDPADEVCVTTLGLVGAGGTPGRGGIGFVSTAPVTGAVPVGFGRLGRCRIGLDSTTWVTDASLAATVGFGGAGVAAGRGGTGLHSTASAGDAGVTAIGFAGAVGGAGLGGTGLDSTAPATGVLPVGFGEICRGAAGLDSTTPVTCAGLAATLGFGGTGGAVGRGGAGFASTAPATGAVVVPLVFGGVAGAAGRGRIDFEITLLATGAAAVPFGFGGAAGAVGRGRIDFDITLPAPGAGLAPFGFGGAVGAVGRGRMDFDITLLATGAGVVPFGFGDATGRGGADFGSASTAAGAGGSGASGLAYCSWPNSGSTIDVSTSPGRA